MKKIIRSSRKFYQAKINTEDYFKGRGKLRPKLLSATDRIVEKYFDKTTMKLHGVTQHSVSNYLAAFVSPACLQNELKAIVGKENTLPLSYVSRMKEVE